jgi:WD40-like Beta Propeller Repeat
MSTIARIAKIARIDDFCVRGHESFLERRRPRLRLLIVSAQPPRLRSIAGLTRNLATNIWEQPLAGGNPVQVSKFSSGDMFGFAWSRDGKQLAFSRGQRTTDVIMMSNFR